MDVAVKNSIFFKRYELEGLNEKVHLGLKCPARRISVEQVQKWVTRLRYKVPAQDLGGIFY